MRALAILFLVIRALAAQYENLDHVWGRITKIGSAEFEVDQNFNADPQSAYRRRPRQIVFNSHTRFEASASEDLHVGRTVDIIGLKMNSSRVKATRIIVYEGNAPVRMPAGAAVLAPDGSLQTKR
jgi:hypothetical protein